MERIGNFVTAQWRNRKVQVVEKSCKDFYRWEKTKAPQGCKENCKAP